MGRTPRPDGAGLTHHVMTRGNNRQPIFDGDLDRRSFLALVEETRERRDWRIHAWCLMTNHVHLLITTDRPTLSDGLRDILGTYARRHNHFHERTGHLFSGRFRSVPVTSDEQFLTVVRYVNRNPVGAGMVDRPEHYPWSGYGSRGSVHPPITIDEADLLRRFHPVRTIAERQMHALVQSEPWPTRAGRHQPAIGTLLQAMGPKRGVTAAVSAGHRRSEIAATLGRSVSYVDRRAA